MPSFSMSRRDFVYLCLADIFVFGKKMRPSRVENLGNWDWYCIDALDFSIVYCITSDYESVPFCNRGYCCSVVEYPVGTSCISFYYYWSIWLVLIVVVRISTTRNVPLVTIVSVVNMEPLYIIMNLIIDII